MKFSSEIWLKRYVHFLIKYNVWIIAGFVVLIALSLSPATRIQFKTSFQDLLPPQAESVRNIEELSKIYGGEGASVLIIKGRPIPDLVAFADELAPKLEAQKHVTHVSYKLEGDFFVSNALLFIDLKDLKEIERRIKKKIAYEEKRNNPLLIQLEEMIDDFSLADILGKYPTNQFQKHLSIPSKNMLVMLIKPNGSATDIGFLDRFMNGVNESVRDLTKDPRWAGIQAAQHGRYQDAFEDNIQLNKDLAITAVLSMILVLAILMFFYRDVKALFLIFFPLMTGVVFNFAVTQFSIGHLNMLSGFLTGILAGLGLEMGIYLLSRYYEEKHRHPWPRALINCLKQTGAAALVAAMTTAASFYSLVFFEFRGFSEFGLIAGNGMVLTSLAMMTLFPSVIVFFEKNRRFKIFRLHAPKTQHRDSHQTSWYYPLHFQRNAVRIVFAVAILVAFFQVRRVSFDYDFNHIRGENVSSQEDLRLVEKELNLSLTPTVLLVTNMETARSIVKEIRGRVKKGELSTVLDANSILDFLPEDQEEKVKIVGRLRQIYLKYQPAIETLPEAGEIKNIGASLNPKPFGLADVPEVLKREFMSKDGRHFFVNVRPSISVNDGSLMSKLIADIKSISTPPAEYKAAGTTFVFAEMFSLIYKSGPKILGLTFLAVLLLVVLLFRNLKDIAIIMTTICVSLFLGIILMTAFGLPFNYLNVIVIPILFGMGIDNAIHIIYRLRRTTDPLPKLMHHISQAVLASSITNILGFATLILAQFQGLRSIGFLATYGMLSVIITSLVFLPAFLPLFYREARIKVAEPVQS